MPKTVGKTNVEVHNDVVNTLKNARQSNSACSYEQCGKTANKMIHRNATVTMSFCTTVKTT